MSAVQFVPFRFSAHAQSSRPFKEKSARSSLTHDHRGASVDPPTPMSTIGLKLKRRDKMNSETLNRSIAIAAALASFAMTATAASPSFSYRDDVLDNGTSGTTPLPQGGFIDHYFTGGSPLNSTYSDTNDYDSGVLNSLVQNGGSARISNHTAMVANLATGSFGTSASSSYTSSLTSGTISANSSSSITYSDTLNFNVPNATASTVNYVTLTLALSGNVQWAPTRSTSSVGVQLTLVAPTAGQFQGQMSYLCTLASCPQTNAQNYSAASGYASTITNGSNGLPDLLTVKVPLVGVAPSVALTFSMQSSTVGIASSDFIDTARFGVTSAPGVTFSSASGVFLTSPVPEPGSAWLLASGAAALAAFARRRRSGSAERA